MSNCRTSSTLSALCQGPQRGVSWHGRTSKRYVRVCKEGVCVRVYVQWRIQAFPLLFLSLPSTPSLLSFLFYHPPSLSTSLLSLTLLHSLFSLPILLELCCYQDVARQGLSLPHGRCHRVQVSTVCVCVCVCVYLCGLVGERVWGVCLYVYDMLGCDVLYYTVSVVNLFFFFLVKRQHLYIFKP